MSLLSGGQSDFFGLDIGTLSLRAVELRGAGATKSLLHYGQLKMSPAADIDDSVVNPQALGQAILQLVKDAGITTKNVAVNLPSQRVFTALVDINNLAPAELAKSIRYQADSFIPTPLAKSKIDWAVLGPSPKDPKKVEVLLSSVPNEFIEARLDLLETNGFNVVAMEPDNIALARSIIARGATAPSLVLDIGSLATDLMIVMNGTPRLARSIPVGTRPIVRTAMQNLAVEEAAAEQFVFKFGLSKDKLEGKVYNAIVGTIDGLMAEIDKSIKFIQERYPEVKLERIIVTGGASTIPELPLYIANKFGINVEIGNAWLNVSVPAGRQNELMAVGNHFAVAAGLAERQL